MRTKKIILTLLTVGFILGGVAPLAALAIGPLDNANSNLNTALGGTGLAGGSAAALPNLIGTLISGVLAVVGTIFLCLTIYAGITWMTAAGNEEKITKAVEIIKACAIGLFITLAAYTITYFVSSKVGGNQTTAPSASTMGCCVGTGATTACAANQPYGGGCGTSATWVQGPCPSSCTTH